MSVTAASTEEESFIVLGSSPGASLLHSPHNSGPEALQLDEAIKDFSNEASLAFKAHFLLSNTPSASSMLTACSMVTDERSMEELRKQFGELLDENVILKETLRSNNDSLRDKFLLIASCQEDVMRTHHLHRDKFRETRELVERLRTENRQLKEEVRQLLERGAGPVQSGAEAAVRGASLAYEFVASPDEDTLQKLTAQLELVEKQRRQVIAENEKLTWQKESLEHIVDATAAERDELRDKLLAVELENSKKLSALQNEIQNLQSTVKDLESKLQQAENLGSRGGEEAMKRDSMIHILELKLSGLQADLKSAQLKILQLEDLKLELSRVKASGAEAARLHREQTQQLLQRLKEAQSTVFQPVRLSIGAEGDLPGSQPAVGYVANVKLYDKSVKHLAQLLDTLTHGALEGFSGALELAAQAQAGEAASGGNARAGLARLRAVLETQHSAALAAVGQVRATISIFEKIFEDYKEVLKNQMSASNEPTASSSSMDALTAALVSRDQELQSSAAEVTHLRAAVATLQKESEERDHLRAQMDVYKADFEAERESRQKLASDKESIMSDLRGLQRRNQTLTEQLEEVRRLNPNIFLSATSKRPSAPRAPAVAASNTVYTCPKCQVYSCDQYKLIEDHVQACLDL